MREIHDPGAPLPQLRDPPFRTVGEVLDAVRASEPPNVLALTLHDDGSLEFHAQGLSCAKMNWLLDRMKAILLGPPLKDETFNYLAPRGSAPAASGKA